MKFEIEVTQSEKEINRDKGDGQGLKTVFLIQIYPLHLYPC